MDEKIILDLMDIRPRTTAGATLPAALSIQNLSGVLYQVDDAGNQTPLIGTGTGGITAITGDITATGPGNVTGTIGAKKVTYAKIQDVSDQVILGNVAGAPGSIQELSSASVRNLLALAAIASTGSASDLTSGTVASARLPNTGPGAGTIGGAVVSSITLDAQGRVTAAAAFTSTATRVVFGGAGNSLAQSAGLTFDDTAGARRLTLTGDATAGATPIGIVANAINAPGSVYRVGGFDRQVGGSSIFLQQFTVSSATFVTYAEAFNATNFPGVTRAQYTIGQTAAGARTGFLVDMLGNDTGLGDGAGLATNATLGFAWLPITTAGAPTGVPASTALVGAINFRAPMTVDSTNKRAYYYVNGAWHFSAIDDGAGGGSGTVTSVSAGASGLIAIGGTPTVTPTVDLAAIAAHTFIANNTGGSAVPAAVNTAGAWNILGVQPAANFPALTGAITTSAGALATTLAASAVGTSNIAANAVTLAKLATIADQEILGNVSGGTAVPAALSSANVWSMLATTPPTVTPLVDVTYDLGSSSKTWRAAYVQTVNAATFQGPSTATQIQNGSGDATHINVGATEIDVKGNVIPTASATYNIGSSSALWNQVWAASFKGAISWNGFVGATPISFTDNAGTALMQFASGALTMYGTAWGAFGSNAAQQASGANLTNNVTAGGTTDTVANYTDLVVYANDAAAIRNDIYQLSRKVKQINDGLRAYGLFT